MTKNTKAAKEIEEVKEEVVEEESSDDEVIEKRPAVKEKNLMY